MITACFSRFIEANALVFREQYPAFLSDKRQPYRVFGSGGKVRAVALVVNAAPGERLQNWFAVVKILVEVENEAGLRDDAGFFLGAA